MNPKNCFDCTLIQRNEKGEVVKTPYGDTYLVHCKRPSEEKDIVEETASKQAVCCEEV